jgi:hypothetical protein
VKYLVSGVKCKRYTPETFTHIYIAKDDIFVTSWVGYIHKHGGRQVLAGARGEEGARSVCCVTTNTGGAVYTYGIDLMCSLNWDKMAEQYGLYFYTCGVIFPQMCDRGAEQYRFEKSMLHHPKEEEEEEEEDASTGECMWSVCEEFRDKYNFAHQTKILHEDKKFTFAQTVQLLPAEGFGTTRPGFMNIPRRTTRLNHVDQKRFWNPIHPTLLTPSKEPPPSPREILPPTYRFPKLHHRRTINMLH